VAYRQEVLRELDDGVTRHAMTAFCSRIRVMSGLRDQMENPAHPVQQDLRFLAAAHTYGMAVATLATDLGTAAPTLPRPARPEGIPARLHCFAGIHVVAAGNDRSGGRDERGPLHHADPRRAPPGAP
jgi:hypothetical protein